MNMMRRSRTRWRSRSKLDLRGMKLDLDTGMKLDLGPPATSTAGMKLDLDRRRTTSIDRRRPPASTAGMKLDRRQDRRRPGGIAGDYRQEARGRRAGDRRSRSSGMPSPLEIVEPVSAR